MRATRWTTLSLAALLLACGDKESGDDTSGTIAVEGDTDTDTDADTDTDTDADADADTDTDADADTDADTDADVDCDDGPTPEPIDADLCITDRMPLGCNESIVSTVEGGTQQLTGEAYANWFCEVVSDNDYTGTERMFEFIHPASGGVEFTLDTPCDDLDLFVFAWGDEESCPSAGVSITDCEGKTGGSDTHSVNVWNNREARYLVAVEGEDSPEVPFALTITCP